MKTSPSSLPPKKIKSIPQFQREDPPWQRNFTYALIKNGDLKTVRIGARQYIVMSSFEDLLHPSN